MSRVCFCLTISILAGWPVERLGADPLVVHEWGTFTELQSVDGVSIGGINTDDEPVPDFVHRIASNVVQSTVEPWRQTYIALSKSVPWSNRITTRLETPVIYFYLPTSQKKPLKIDVEVQLRGGWLSEYYPNAEANAPGLHRTGLGKHAAGSLKWRGLEIGGSGAIPETDDSVWLAPRGPDSATVVTQKGEAEEYLFYRGVGRFSGPLRVESDVERNRLQLTSRLHALDVEFPLEIPAAWLVEVTNNGDIAFQALGRLIGSADRPEIVSEINRNFKESDFAGHNLDLLREQMHSALVEDGLFAEEATAMLATWNRAYFQSPGKRVFYLLPQVWTDDRMPLTLSVPAEVRRVMMGRIELVTDRHIELLELLCANETGSTEWRKKLNQHDPIHKRFLAGDNSVAKRLGFKLPAQYLTYLELGRFRNALVNHTRLQTKNMNVSNFAKTYGLIPKGG